MPLTLASTRALRGEKRHWTLIVTSHGRWDYLHRTMDSIAHTVGLDFFDRRVLSYDGEGPVWLDGFTEHHSTGARSGLTANLAQAWATLGDDEWCFHVEEDFLILEAPLDDMADTLEAFPQVAQMVLVRQPISPEEQRAGSVLGGQHMRGRWEDMGGWVSHRQGFWLNPFVAHSRTLKALTPGVEKELTCQALQQGWRMAYWGSPEDDPRCVHIGTVGGMHSEGWLP